jgi:hypothetical protein
MIAEMALQDLSQGGGREQGSDQLGWSGPEMLMSGRGHVNWTGERRFSGPRLGPPSPRRKHRSSPRRNMIGDGGGGGSSVASTAGSTAGSTARSTAASTNVAVGETESAPSEAKEKRRNRHKGVYRTVIPHQGGPAYKSSLNFCFDNEGTIRERMREIYDIADHHNTILSEKEGKRRRELEEKERHAIQWREMRNHPPGEFLTDVGRYFLLFICDDNNNWFSYLLLLAGRLFERRHY